MIHDHDYYAQVCKQQLRDLQNFYVEGLIQLVGIKNQNFMAHSLQIKSLSLGYKNKKSDFFNMVQPIDLIFCKMIETIQSILFNHADFVFRS